MLDPANDEVKILVARETIEMHYQKPESKQSKANGHATTDKRPLAAMCEPCKKSALVPECGVRGSWRRACDLPDGRSGVHGAAMMRRPTRGKAARPNLMKPKASDLCRCASQALMMTMAVGVRRLRACVWGFWQRTRRT